MTEELLVQLIAEVEKEDPVDFANLPFDEQMLRNLVCKLVSRQLTQMEDAHFNQDEVIVSLTASIAKLVLENLVLNARLLAQQGHTETARELLDRIARQAKGIAAQRATLYCVRARISKRLATDRPRIAASSSSVRTSNSALQLQPVWSGRWMHIARNSHCAHSGCC